MEQIKINDNVNIIYIENEKFKTNLISVFFKRPLKREEVTKNVLLPYVLCDSTQKYKTQSDIEKRMQELYSSKIDSNVSKSGERQIISFKLSFVSDRYLQEKITDDAIDLLTQIIFHPNIENGGFSKEYVKLAKDAVEQDILAIINNKDKYAYNRTVELMFKGENYAVNQDGYIEDLKEIDEKNLYKYYKEFISTSQIDIVVAGSFDKEATVSSLAKYFDVKIDAVNIEKEKPHKHNECGMVEEKMDIAQGKLVVGYSFDIAHDSEDYYKFMMYSEILGGGPASKLFNIVREKHSLCYSVFSMIDRYKGTMMIMAGIDHENKAKTVKLIDEIMDDIVKGDVSEDDMTAAINHFNYSLEALNDSLEAMSGFYYAQKLTGTPKTPDEVKAILSKVTAKDVSEIGKRAKKDIEYFLTKTN